MCGAAPAWQLPLGAGVDLADMGAMQDQDGGRRARLESVLARDFAPILLRVDDDSAQHAGHAGAADGGQSHFSVVLVSAAFRGQSRVARSRAVHAALADEFAGGMHALALTLRTPEEHASV